MKTKQSHNETSLEHPPSLQGLAAQAILENEVAGLCLITLNG